MLSTFHSDSMTDKRRRSRTVPGGIETIKKPHMVEDYNKHMGGVDMSDQFVGMLTGTTSGGRESSSTFLTCASSTLTSSTT